MLEIRSGNFFHRAQARAVRDAKRALFAQKNAQLAERLASFSQSQPRAERAWLRSCMTGLAQESREENYYGGLFNLAIQLKSDLQEGASETILEFLTQADVPEEIRRCAQAERNALRGEGNFGRQAESFFSRLADGSSNLRAIVPMIGATVVGQVAGATFFGSLARAGWSGLLGGTLRKKFLAGLGALVLETPTLVGLNHLFSSGPRGDLGEEFLLTGMSLGVFRASSWLGSQVPLPFVRGGLGRGRGSLPLPPPGPLLTKEGGLVSQAFSFLGLLASQYLVNGRVSSSDAFFSSLHLLMGNALGRLVLGRGWARFQAETAVRAQHNGDHGMRFQVASPVLRGRTPEGMMRSERWNDSGIQLLFMKSQPPRSYSPTSIEEIQGRILRRDPLSSEEARQIIREILDPRLSGDVLLKYQALFDMIYREDFEDFSALMRALDRLGKREQPIAWTPLFEWLWSSSGLQLSAVPRRMDLQRIKAQSMEVFSGRGVLGPRIFPVVFVIALDEKPPDLGELRAKIESSPRVANAVLLTEAFAALAEYRKLRRAKNFRFLIRKLRRQGEILREAGIHELDIGRGLATIIEHRGFAGTRNIEEFLKALPYASGSRSTGFHEPKILQGLLAHPDFSLDLDIMAILNFLNEHVADPMARLILLGELGGDPHFSGEPNFQLLLLEFKQASVGLLTAPPDEENFRYRNILTMVFGQVAANRRLTNPVYALDLLLSMGLSPEEMGSPFLRIAGNPHFRDSEGFRRMAEVLWAIKESNLRAHYFGQLVFNPRLPEPLRQELMQKYEKIDIHEAVQLYALLLERRKLQ